MTPKNELCIFKPEDSISRALNVMNERNYDVVPIETNGVLDRFVEREALMGKPSSLICDKVAQNITVKHIISKHASIESLLPLFCQQNFFFVMGQREVVGIVTYADLNKTVVKTLFYLLISDVEATLLKLIKQRFSRIEDCLQYLSPKQKETLKETLNQARKENTEISMEHYLSTSQIITIVSEDAKIRKKLGFTSRNQAIKKLNPLVNLRNKVMHQRPLITHKQDVGKLNQKYDILLDIIQRFQNKRNKK